MIRRALTPPRPAAHPTAQDQIMRDRTPSAPLFRRAALALAALAALALAGAPGREAAAKGAGAPSAATLPAEGEALIVHIGKAKVVNLARPARDVLISDPAVVDSVMRTATQPVLFGQRVGAANVLFFDDSNAQIRSLQVRVEYDTAILNQMIRRQFPEADVRAESVLGELILSGRVNASADAKQIEELAARFALSARVAVGQDADAEGAAESVTNRIAVLNEEQVHLKVRVAEVSRSVLKELGVDWNAGLQSASLSTLFSIENFNFASGPATIPINIESLESFLQVMERYALVRTLAEPSLTAVSGETASFLAGGEFPIPVGAGDGAISIEFKSFGVGLDFTPVVTGEDQISMQVSTEVSEIDTANSVTLEGTTVPGLSLRRANTTVEMSSGGTIMIAGLIQQSTRRLSTGIPGLRSLPILGSFFRAEEHEIEETELVIMVTPYTVRQNAPAAFAAPTDGFAPASDLDVYLFGRLHQVYGAGDPQDPAIRQQASDLKAPIGFMME
ncbi:MAG: type II and III secretion system protein family protein [Pseudomonadota bacterium]